MSESVIDYTHLHLKHPTDRKSDGNWLLPLPKIHQSEQWQLPWGSAHVRRDERSLHFKVEGKTLPQWGGISLQQGTFPIGLDFEWADFRAVFERRSERGQLQYDRRSEPPVPDQVPRWRTQSQQGYETLWLAHRMAQTSMNMYLAGETGVGKEVLARMIHAWSHRCEGPFIALNCAALPANLAESELFGHLKGAFTGADAMRQGALASANRGTLFLDEIADLSLEVQAKLLRFLESGELRPLGSDRVHFSDARVLCATHKDLRKRVEEGEFREDLFYRVASLCIPIPALRERIADITLLARHYAHEHHKTLHPDALVRLRSHPWKGNVRELRHVIERACGFVPRNQRVLRKEDFGFLDHAGGTLTLKASLPASLSLRVVEKHLLLQALQKTGGNRSEAARMLGVGRSTIFSMLKRHRVRPMEQYSLNVN